MKTWIQLKNTNKHELPVEFQDDDVRFSESLVEFFLNEYTQENDLVFDPFVAVAVVVPQQS